MSKPIRYDQFVTGLRGKQLEDGVGKTGKYQRKVEFAPGYEELAKVVAGLGKEIKRINQCLTLEGAQEYASKRKNWQADEADITGPRGLPDGIKEVYVTDSKGRVKVINGHGLAKSEYPVRKAYRTKYDTPKKRSEKQGGKSYTTFLNELHELAEGWDEHGDPHYVMDAAKDIGAEFANLQPEIKAKDVYKRFLFQPVYAAIKEDLKSDGVPPMTMAQIFNKSLSEAYKLHIETPALTTVLGGDPSSYADKEINKAKRSAEFRGNTEGIMTDLLNEQEQIDAAQSEINDIIMHVIDKVVNEPQDAFKTTIRTKLGGTKLNIPPGYKGRSASKVALPASTSELKVEDLE